MPSGQASFQKCGDNLKFHIFLFQMLAVQVTLISYYWSNSQKFPVIPKYAFFAFAFRVSEYSSPGFAISQSNTLRELYFSILFMKHTFFYSATEATAVKTSIYSQSFQGIWRVPTFLLVLHAWPFRIGSWNFQSCFAELFLKSFVRLPHCFHSAIRWSTPNLLWLYS